MQNPLLHILLAVWRQRAAAFWPIWTTTTAFAGAGVAWVVRQTATSPLQIATQAPVIRTRRTNRTGGSVAALTLLAVLLVCYVALTLKWEDFADYDDAYYTTFTLNGQNFGPPIWREAWTFLSALPSGVQPRSPLYHLECRIPCPATRRAVHPRLHPLLA